MGCGLEVCGETNLPWAAFGQRVWSQQQRGNQTRAVQFQRLQDTRIHFLLKSSRSCMAVAWVAFAGLGSDLCIFSFQDLRWKYLLFLDESSHFRQLEPLHVSACGLPAWPRCVPHSTTMVTWTTANFTLSGKYPLPKEKCGRNFVNG